MGHRRRYFVPQSKHIPTLLVKEGFEETIKGTYRKGDAEIKIKGNKIHFRNRKEGIENIIRDTFTADILYAFIETGKLPYPNMAVEILVVDEPAYITRAV